MPLIDPEVQNNFAAMKQFIGLTGWQPSMQGGFEELHAFQEALEVWKATGQLPARFKQAAQRQAEANTITLATDVTSDFKFLRYYNSGATAWPRIGDREYNPQFTVPKNLYKRTVWLQVTAFGGTWWWQGRLVAKLGGQKTFEMPLFFGSGGTATRHLLTVGYDADNTGLGIEDKLQVNDAAGNPLIPFTFIAAAQTIQLEEDNTDPGTSDTRMIFAVLSQSMW